MRQIQQFYNGKLEENLSSSSIHNMHKVLHGALEHAVKERLISINPAKGVSIPQGEKRKIRPLTSEQAQLLLAITQGSTFEPIMVMALTAAMRQGEILSLHWEDINFEAGTIMYIVH